MGMEVVRAWAHGGYTYDFVVAAENSVGHLHGWYDTKTGEFGLDDHPRIAHYNTCRELFPVEGASY